MGVKIRQSNIFFMVIAIVLLTLIVTAAITVNTGNTVIVRAPASGTNYSSGNLTATNPTLFNVSFFNGTLGSAVPDTNGSTTFFNATFWINISDTQWVELANTSNCVTHESGGFFNNISCWDTFNASALLNGTLVSDGYYTVNASIWNGTAHIYTSTANTTTILIDNTVPNVSITTPASGTNHSINIGTNYTTGVGLLLINATVTDSIVGVGTVVVNITNTTHQNFTIIATAQGSSYNATINTSHFPDGTYNISIHANDTVGNINQSESVVSLRFDNTVPEVFAANVTNPIGSGQNYSNVTGLLALNVSFADATTSISNALFNITNSSNNQNATYLATRETDSRVSVSIDTSQFTDGTYNISIAFVNDTAGNKNSSASIIFNNIKFDNTNPSLSLSCSPSSATTGDTVTCTCSPSDSTSGINSSTKSHETTPSTSDTGTFTNTCSVNDNAGNSASASTTYIIESSSSSSSSSSSGGGSSTSWTTYSVKKDDFEKGHMRTLKANQRLKVKIDNSDHTIGVDKVSADSVSIIVTSSPQKATLTVGSSHKFEVTEDNYYDISVTLNKISGSKAEIMVKSIKEEVPEIEPDEPQEEKTEKTASPENKSKSNKVGVGLGIILAALILFIIGVITWAVVNKKRF